MDRTVAHDDSHNQQQSPKSSTHMQDSQVSHLSQNLPENPSDGDSPPRRVMEMSPPTISDEDSVSSALLTLVSKLGPPKDVNCKDLSKALIPADFWNSTSKWKACTTFKVDDNGGQKEVHLDLLQEMNVEKIFVRLEDFFKVGKIEEIESMLPQMAPDYGKPEEEYMELLQTRLTFTVPEWGLHQENPGIPGSGNAFAGYYSARHQERKEIIKDILNDKLNINKKLKEKMPHWTWEVKRQAHRVEDFLETLLKFLSMQEDACEGAYEDLFAAFCSMFGIHFNKGNALRDRVIHVFGHNISSRTDLRSFVNYMEQFNVDYGNLANLKVLLVVEVKPTTPPKTKTDSARKNTTSCSVGSTSDDSSIEEERANAFAHIDNHLGQLFGDMLAEQQYGIDKHSMFGICVQGSRVQLLLLETSGPLMEYIGSDGSKESLQQKPKCRPGKLYITEPKDFLKRDERNDLLEALRRFGKASALA